MVTPHVSHSVVWERYGNRAIEGDRSAIGGLLETYRPLLTALADRQLSASLRAKVSASDLVQQTCEEALRAITQVRASDGQQLWNWLSTLLSRNLYDQHRRYVVCQKRSLRREERLHGSRPSVPSAIPTVENAVLQAELVQRLEHALQRLPLAHREVLRWRFLEDRSCEEIAGMVSRSTDAVRMLVNRALKRLQQELPLDGPGA